ncbi:minor capsid protein [Sphingobacterium psychroaquaticum]|uniref:minor capsid protein n=1 Tax=Sphingobacterium psychroaquaticum TaxID=561061 RepID=UPI000A1CBF2B|nr:minor capsid protein [Sphingobacterium psychroaquaticum]
MRQLWKKKALEKGFDPVLVQAYGEELSDAIDKGYTISEDFTTEDQRKIHSLKKNVWQFSTAKTYAQLRQMSDALVKPDGTMRTFEEFRIQTTIITGEQLRHLKTEYQTAVAGAQMASKWEEIQRMKEAYPLLEFIAVEDEHTTALCRSLDGVIRPVDDSFWMQFYPPNHYNCRSTVKQHRKGEITPDDKILKPSIPDIFKVNLGERGLAFPEDHAYFEGVPAEIIKEARQFFPYAMQFDILDVTDRLKGIVRQHFMTDAEASDYSRVLDYATQQARSKKIIVDIMPTLDPQGHAAQREIIFPDARHGKSADLRIDKLLWEEEGIKTHSRRAIKGAIEAGANQANRVVINIPVDMVLDFELAKVARDKFKDYRDLLTIVFKQGDMEYRFDRKK